MSDLEPLAVALKFGFLAVLYLFLLWVTRMALRDLAGPPRRGTRPATTRFAGATADATDAWLVVEQGGGLKQGERFDLFGGISLGRSPTPTSGSTTATPRGSTPASSTAPAPITSRT